MPELYALGIYLFEKFNVKVMDFGGESINISRLKSIFPD